MVKCTNCHEDTACICLCGKCLKCQDHKNSINKRNDGRIEWVCEHGVGHTIYVPEQFNDMDSWWTHGCDGCCKDMPKLNKRPSAVSI